MAKRDRLELPAELVQAREQLTAWRLTRKPRARIPRELWELAARLAATHGVHRTARALKLEYYALKKRVEAVPDPSENCSAPRTAEFVELPSVVVAAKECAAAKACVLELAQGTRRLRVQLTGYEAADVATIGQRLWSGE